MDAIGSKFMKKVSDETLPWFAPAGFRRGIVSTLSDQIRLNNDGTVSIFHLGKWETIWIHNDGNMSICRDSKWEDVRYV